MYSMLRLSVLDITLVSSLSSINVFGSLYALSMIVGSVGLVRKDPNINIFNI